MKTIKIFLIALVMTIVIAGGYAAMADQGSLTASFNANVNTGVAPLTVYFTDTSTGNPTAWHWDFGDGSSSVLQNPVYTYNTPGTYTITLNVTNGAQNATMSANIVVTTPMVTTPTPTTTPVIVEPILIPVRDPHHDQPPHDHQPPAQQPPHHDQPPVNKHPIGTPTVRPGK